MTDPATPAHPVTLADHEARARARMAPDRWAYFSGGAADGITLRANREAWDALRLLPRVLRPLAHGHTRSTLLGRTIAHPILLAPVALQTLAHPQGEIATALAAAAQQAGMVASTQSGVTLEAIAAAAGPAGERGPLWFQLYLQPDRGATLALVQRAEAAGYEALVLTVDAPVQGARDRERQAGFRLPPGVHAANLAADAPVAGRTAMADALCGGLAAQAPTWADVEWLRGATRLPLLLKGVLHPDDARQARACGADGLVVSNHGGRTLDTVHATAECLPRIADTTGGAWPLLVDGGIRRGTDVFKALALGAHAVLVGRPQIWGLASGGAAGVAQVIRLLRDELEIAMVLAGCATLLDVRESALLPAAAAGIATARSDGAPTL